MTDTQLLRDILKELKEINRKLESIDASASSAEQGIWNSQS